MRNRSIARAIKVGIGTILAVVVLFFVFSWIAEYRPAGRETTLYDKTEPEYLPDTLTVVSWNIGYAGLGDNMDFFYDGGRRVRDSRARTAQNLQEIIRTLCKYKDVEILEGHMMPDHVHLLISIPPKTSVSSFMGYLKGKSALMMFDKHANLKYKFGNRHFWAEGYYVSTVGLNESTIRKYIEDQEKHDIALDKLSVKEYEDPFKGSK